MALYESLHEESNIVLLYKELYRELWDAAMEKEWRECNKVAIKDTSKLYFVRGPYSSLMKKLYEKNDVEQNKATLADLKAYIKRKDSGIWIWPIMMGIATLLFEIVYNLFSRLKTNIAIPNAEIPYTLYKGKGVIERLSLNNIISATTTSEVDISVGIVIALVVLICIAVPIDLYFHGKNQYLLSIVESVEKDYNDALEKAEKEKQTTIINKEIFSRIGINESGDTTYVITVHKT